MIKIAIFYKNGDWLLFGGLKIKALILRQILATKSPKHQITQKFLVNFCAFEILWQRFQILPSKSSRSLYYCCEQTKNGFQTDDNWS